MYLAEYREIEAEKRTFSQALLAVWGLAAGAAAVLIANIDATDPIAAAGLLPLVTIFVWLSVTLRAYIGLIMEHLLSIQDAIAGLTGLETGKSWTSWELRWFQGASTGGDRRVFGIRLGIVVIVAMVFGVLVLTPLSLWGLLGSAAMRGFAQGWSRGESSGGEVLLIGALAYLAVNAFILVMAAAAWRSHEGRIHAWRAAGDRVTSEGVAGASKQARSRDAP